jgi:hypothetical protein
VSDLICFCITMLHRGRREIHAYVVAILLDRLVKHSGWHPCGLGSIPHGRQIAMSEINKTLSSALRYSKHRFVAPAHSQGNRPLCAGGVWGSEGFSHTGWGVFYLNVNARRRMLSPAVRVYFFKIGATADVEEPPSFIVSTTSRQFDCTMKFLQPMCCNHV